MKKLSNTIKAFFKGSFENRINKSLSSFKKTQHQLLAINKQMIAEQEAHQLKIESLREKIVYKNKLLQSNSKIIGKLNDFLS